MVLTEPLTFSIFLAVFKKTVSLILLVNFCQKRFFLSLAMMNCKKNVVYIGLEDIESKGVFDWRKRARDWLRAHLRRKRESFRP